jgi:hypothetical protein
MASREPRLRPRTESGETPRGRGSPMSAMVVPKEHIDALLTLAVQGPCAPAGPDRARRWQPLYWYEGDVESGELLGRVIAREDLDEVGASLLGTCIASVARYFPEDLWPELPGVIPNPNPLEYRFEAAGPHAPTAVEGLKLLDIYERSSCEHPDIESAAVECFCDSLRRRLIQALPGYEAAPFRWPPKKAIDARA